MSNSLPENYYRERIETLLNEGIMPILESDRKLSLKEIKKYLSICDELGEKQIPTYWQKRQKDYAEYEIRIGWTHIQGSPILPTSEEETAKTFVKLHEDLEEKACSTAGVFF